ncbi:hypothetical protein DUI87_26433 [Hirundo rustica rustica]|uniref:Uncharacterized protein n=1 Tax=Hirundo rustica rustica TaxID=333673 RepID=A0A3M0JEN1_HIRRU|nr:hypothetical protein DUI87_26433 [Hirundo rustica rustica]
MFCWTFGEYGWKEGGRRKWLAWESTAEKSGILILVKIFLASPTCSCIEEMDHASNLAPSQLTFFYLTSCMPALLLQMAIQNLRKWPEAESGEVYVSYQKKILHPEAGWALEQAPQRSGHSISLTEFKKFVDNALRHTVAVRTDDFATPNRSKGKLDLSEAVNKRLGQLVFPCS